MDYKAFVNGVLDGYQGQKMKNISIGKLNMDINKQLTENEEEDDDIIKCIRRHVIIIKSLTIVKYRSDVTDKIEENTKMIHNEYVDLYYSNNKQEEKIIKYEELLGRINDNSEKLNKELEIAVSLRPRWYKKLGIYSLGILFALSTIILFASVITITTISLPISLPIIGTLFTTFSGIFADIFASIISFAFWRICSSSMNKKEKVVKVATCIQKCIKETNNELRMKTTSIKQCNTVSSNCKPNQINFDYHDTSTNSDSKGNGVNIFDIIANGKLIIDKETSAKTRSKSYKNLNK